MSSFVLARATALRPQRRHVPRSRAVALGLWLIAFMVHAIALSMWFGRGMPELPASFMRGPVAPLAIVLCSFLATTLGAFLASRIPDNPVAWLLLLEGVVLAPVLVVTVGVWDSLGVLRSTPGLTLMAAWLASTLVAPIGVGSLAAVLFLFPDGHSVSRRWRWALLVPLGGTFLLSMGSALDSTMIWYPALPMPAGLPGWAAAIAMPARLAGVAALALATILAAASVTLRYRHGDADVRRQLRWIVLDGAILVATVPPFLLGRYLFHPGDATGELLLVLAVLGAATFPVVVVIAITRADLFDIDLIIGRTLVYLPLTAILAGFYAASVALLQRLFVLLTGDTSDAVMLLSTLLLAAAFTPVKGALDGVVERHFRTPVRSGTPATSADAAAALVSPAPPDHTRIIAQHADLLTALEERIRELEAALVTNVAPPRATAASSPEASSRPDGRRQESGQPRARRPGSTPRRDQAPPPRMAEPRPGNGRTRPGNGCGSGTRQGPGKRPASRPAGSGAAAGAPGRATA